MSSLKLQKYINEKNYTAVRKLNVSKAQRFKLKNYAINRKVLSIASLLNDIPDYTKMRYKYKHNPYVKLYEKFYTNYTDGDYTSIGNAAKLMSFYFYSLIPKEDLLGNNLKNFRGQRFSKILTKDIDEKVLKRFKKIRQWPHLTLMLFPKFNSGSCHDYTLLRAMVLEQQNVNYKLEISTGTNTLLSHMNLRKMRSPRKPHCKHLYFLLMTLFHAFRTHQTLKYITKSSKKMRTLENTLYSIILSCTNNETLTLNLLQYLLTRRHSSYNKIKKT